MRPCRLLLVPLAALLCAGAPPPKTYWVRQGGDNTKDGSNNTDKAWATLARACDLTKNPHPAAGDTVRVMPGNYAGFICDPLNGSSGKMITIVSDTPLGAVINTSVVDGQGAQHCATFLNSSYVHFEGFTFSGCTGLWAIAFGHSTYMEAVGHSVDGAPTGAGAVVAGTINATLSDSTFVHNGIAVGHDWTNAKSSNVTLSANSVSHAPAAALTVGDASDVVAYNNLFFRNAGIGIAVVSGGALVAYNNTVFQGTGDGWCVDAASGATSLLAENNILITGGGAGVIADQSVAGVVTSNDNVVTDAAMTGYQATWSSHGTNPIGLATWQLVTSNDASSLSSDYDHEFLDTTNDDYRLKVGAKAIGHGVATIGTQSAPTIDIEGAARDPLNVDIGAYVYVPYDAGPVPPDAGAPIVLDSGVAEPDTGVPAAVDSGVAEADTGVPVAVDSGVPVAVDSGLPVVVDSGSPVVVDSGAPVEVDSGAPAKVDAGAPVEIDSGVPVE